MKLTKMKQVYSLLGVVVLAAMAVGCSESDKRNPLTSSATASTGTRFSGGEVEVAGHVATIDANSRMMTLAGYPATIEIAAAAEVVLRDNNGETPIMLSQINPSDSAEVRGTMQGNGTLLADRVRIRVGEDGNEVETGGRVETIDAIARTLTLRNNPTLYQIAPNAEVVQKISGTETPIDLDDIVPGDSVDVRGNAQANGSVLVDRLRLRVGFDDDFASDLEFKGEITAIDYNGSTFSVDSRPGVISVNANTFIFVKVDFNDTVSSTAKRNGESADTRLKQRIQFTDLVAGDTVEVYANVTGLNTYYAVAVELEDGAFENEQEVEFKSVLASVDANTRVVTFTTQSWIGNVHPEAALTGLNNETLLLSAFSAGQIVEVRGFAQANGDLMITEMKRDNNL